MPKEPATETPETTLTLADIVSIEIQAVVGGASERITFGPGTNPAEVLPYLQTLDPNVEVYTKLSTGKNGAWGKDTKDARCVVLKARENKGVVYIEFSCQNGNDFTADASKFTYTEIVAALKTLEKIPAEKRAKILKVIEEKKGEAMIILPLEEHFGVKYTCTKDDPPKYWVNSITPEPPALPETKPV